MIKKIIKFIKRIFDLLKNKERKEDDLPRGLQVFDGEGNEVFNSETRTFQLIKKIEFRVNQSETVTHPFFEKEAGMTPIVIASPTYFGGSIAKIVHLGGSSVRVDMMVGSKFVFTGFTPNKINYFNDYDNITLLLGVY